MAHPPACPSHLSHACVARGPTPLSLPPTRIQPKYIQTPPKLQGLAFLPRWFSESSSLPSYHPLPEIHPQVHMTPPTFQRTNLFCQVVVRTIKPLPPPKSSANTRNSPQSFKQLTLSPRWLSKTSNLISPNPAPANPAPSICKKPPKKLQDTLPSCRGGCQTRRAWRGNSLRGS